MKVFIYLGNGLDPIDDYDTDDIVEIKTATTNRIGITFREDSKYARTHPDKTLVAYSIEFVPK